MRPTVTPPPNSCEGSSDLPNRRPRRSRSTPSAGECSIIEARPGPARGVATTSNAGFRRSRASGASWGSPTHSGRVVVRAYTICAWPCACFRAANATPIWSGCGRAALHSSPQRPGDAEQRRQWSGASASRPPATPSRSRPRARSGPPTPRPASSWIRGLPTGSAWSSLAARSRPPSLRHSSTPWSAVKAGPPSATAAAGPTNRGDAPAWAAAPSATGAGNKGSTTAFASGTTERIAGACGSSE